MGIRAAAEHARCTSELTALFGLIDADNSEDLTKKEILAALSKSQEAAEIIRGNPKLAPLGKPRTPPEVARLAEYCHVLFNANLFLYLD